MLSHLKISQKVYLLGISQLTLILILGGVSIIKMQKIGVELYDIAEQDIPLTNQITQITEKQLEQDILFEKVLRYSLLAEQDHADSQQKFVNYRDKTLTLESTISNQIDKTLVMIESAKNNAHSQEGIDEFIYLADRFHSIKKDHFSLAQQIQNIFSKIDTTSIRSINNEIEAAETLAHHIDEDLIKALDHIQKFTLKSALQAEHDELAAIEMIIYIFSFALIFALIAPFIISNSIVQPIINLKERLVEVSKGDGDLTLQLDEGGRDETSDVSSAFNQFISSLRDSIQSAQAQANNLSNSSETALSVMQATQMNVDKQRSETAIVATAVNDMNATTHDVAESSANAAKITKQVKDSVLQGKEGAQETQSIIQQLSTEVSDASEVIQSLVSETNKIGNVLAAIQGIAEQTNLLALNAAIEAARAGETGRGFAVVADEVRSLAQRTQSSTVDIQSLVQRLQSEAQNAVASMEKGSQSANLCLDKSQEASIVFEEAASAVEQISDINMKIASAAAQQSSVASEINESLMNISKIAEDTSEGASQACNSNESIGKSLIDLNIVLKRFRT